jgi:hypothetical protein
MRQNIDDIQGKKKLFSLFIRTVCYMGRVCG